MSSNVECVLVKDDLLMVSDKIGFAVEMGGSNVSTQKFVATSANQNSHIYTLQIPSTSVILDRELMWTSTFSITLTADNVAIPPNIPLVQLGFGDALSPFPLANLCSNIQAQINTTTASVVLNRIVDPLCRVMDRKKLAENYAFTPTYLDNVGNYTQLVQVGTLNGFPEPVPYLNSPLAGYGNAVDPNYPPRGSFRVDDITGNTSPWDGATDVVITFTCTEPIMLSPFIYGDEDKSTGLTGVQNINLTMNIDATCSRAFRWAQQQTYFTNKRIKSIEFPQSQSYVECRFLTPHATDLVPATCVSPFQNIVNYPTSNQTLLEKSGVKSVGKITSNNVQLNSIPDLLLCFVRQNYSLLKPYDADAYCAITGISVNFNNNNGILSGATPQMLWKMSKEAGSKQSWLEFSGSAHVDCALDEGYFTTNNAPTSGSILALKFGQHIQISESYLASGSQGSFNFQITVDVRNTTGVDISQPELNVVVVNSGIFVSQNGQSSSYTGILTKQQVLDTQLQAPVARTELNRMLGGGFFSKLKAIAHKAFPHVKAFLTHVAPHVKSHVASIAKEKLAESSNPYAKYGTKALELAGYGMSGGMDGRLSRHMK